MISPRALPRRARRLGFFITPRCRAARITTGWPFSVYRCTISCCHTFRHDAFMPQIFIIDDFYARATRKMLDFKDAYYIRRLFTRAQGRPGANCRFPRGREEAYSRLRILTAVLMKAAIGDARRRRYQLRHRPFLELCSAARDTIFVDGRRLRAWQ